MFAFAILPLSTSWSLASAQGWTGSPQATLIVYRVSSVVGGIYKPSVFGDEGELLRMRNGRFATFPLKPGPHTLTSTLDGNKVTFDAKPGETYYVCVTMATYSQYGTFKGQVTQVEAGRAKAEIAKLKPADAADLK